LGDILRPILDQEVDFVDENVLPKCLKCDKGQLVPLSDYGSQGAAVRYKAWVCTNPDCGFNVKIRNGDIYLNEPITSGAMHPPPRVR
jgi:hypothetical protein